MEHIEIELKFFIPDLLPLRNRIVDNGAVCIGRRTFEYNVRYEIDDDRLLKNNCLLRLRKDRGTTLTFKAPPPKPDPRFKSYRELEVDVSDFDTMDTILAALGFHRRQVYEKWRETWKMGGVTLCLDTMPFGDFLELEGPPDLIVDLVHHLNLPWKRRMRSSYLSLFAVLREKEGLAFSDLTFDNFKTVSIRFDAYQHLFEAGDGDDG